MAWGTVGAGVLLEACKNADKKTTIDAAVNGDHYASLNRMPEEEEAYKKIISSTFFTGDEMKYFRNDHSDVLHKMGMGDAFTSGFALAYAHGNSIKDCVKFGNEVSLKVAINRGSQSGLPYLRDLDVKVEGED